MLWIIVTRAHGFHGAEPANAKLGDGSFAAACEHDLGIAHLNGAPGFANSMIGGGARRTGGDIWTAQLVEHRENTRSHVQDEHGNHEWRHSSRPFVKQDFVLFFSSGQAANA